ncbi:EthD family reductase [Brevibacillus fluminis]|uniref:EthD family reductase n=1 Tax=Brevibacillus fluminis TaxID=511487 RepID=UPI003F88FED0
MIVLSFYYKHGVPFDADYYMNKHVPMVKEAIVDMGATKCEVKKFLTAPDGSTPLYQYSFSIFFESREALDLFFAHPKLPAFQADVPNYYEGNPDVYIEKLLQA